MAIYIIMKHGYDDTSPLGYVTSQEVAEDLCDRYNATGFRSMVADPIGWLRCPEELDPDSLIRQLEEEIAEVKSISSRLIYGPPKPPWYELVPSDVKELLP